MTASSTQAENDDKGLEVTGETKRENETKSIAKREVIVMDNIPYESSIKHGPKIIYRRMTRQRGYVRPKPKPGLPRPRYGPSLNAKKPLKKYRSRKPTMKKISPQGPYKTHKRQRKPPYKKPPVYPPNPSYMLQEPAGFGEPPSDFMNDYQRQKGYAEPPTDSYGAPLKFNSNPINSFASDPEFLSPQEGPNHNSYNYRPNQNWNDQGYSNNDNSYSPSQKHLSKAKPFETFLSEPSAIEDQLDQEMKFYSEMYNQKLRYELEKKKKFLNDFRAMTKKPVKAIQKSPLVVGGQYAEPPARYMPKFKETTESFAGDDAFLGAKGLSDSDVAGSSASSYVNYKNSNMAFSPQNLNDAFSVID